jgi:hypothetical protein
MKQVMLRLNPSGRPTLSQRIRGKWYGILLAYIGRRVRAFVADELPRTDRNRETTYLLAIEPNGTVWVQYSNGLILHMRLLSDGQLEELDD